MTTRYYHTIEGDNTVDNPLICDLTDFRGIDPWELREGRKVDNWDASSSYGVSKKEYDGQPDDVLQCVPGSLPVFSARLQTILRVDHAASDIQFLPVLVKRHSGEAIDGFAIANIITSLPALDRTASDYLQHPDDYPIELKGGQVRDLKRPVLIASIVEGHDMFRLKEFPLFICVSSRFRTAFEREGCTGYSFRELQAR